MTITLGSLFDGSGGFPLAGSLCGILPVWASEIEPYPIAVTKSRFPDMKHLGDISKINGAVIDPVDIITFGSPCQDLSIAGKRAGLKHEKNGDEETTRSGLFMEAIRIIKEMRCATNGKYPRFALFENVPGAFSSGTPKGEDFRIVLEEFIKISEAKATVPTAPKGGWPYADAYVGDGWSLAYRTFDAQYWGVPQRRRRIYLVADFAGGCAPRILFERQGLRGYFETCKNSWQGTAADAEGSIGTDDRKRYCISFHLTQNPISNNKICHCVSSGNSNCGQASVGVCYPVGLDGYNSVLTGDKSSTLGVNCGVSTGRCGILQPIGFSNVSSTLRSGAGAPKHDADFVGRLVLQPMAFAQNQRNEVRDLKGKAGALASQPGMKQQTYIIEQKENVPVVLFEPRSQDGVPRIHDEISPTLNTAQGGQRQPCIALPVYCIQGNCIDRADTAGCNGKGWREGSSFTLNTIDRPAVACLASGKDKVGTLLANASSKQWLGNQEAQSGDYHIVEEVPQVYRQSAFADYMEGQFGTLRASGGDFGGGSENLISTQYVVRRLTPIECARLQGFPDSWGYP